MANQHRVWDRAAARRIVLAGLVLGVHVAVVQLLFALREPRLPQEKAEPPSLTWISPAVDITPDTPAPASSLMGPGALAPQANVSSLQPLPAPPQITPENAAPAPVPDTGAQAVMRQYMECHLKPNLTDDQRRQCQAMAQALPVGPQAPPKPTEEELALARKFGHDKAREDAAIMLPCVAAMFINPFCVLGLATGATSLEDAVHSYADLGAAGYNSNSGATSLGIRPHGGKPKAGHK